MTFSRIIQQSSRKKNISLTLGKLIVKLVAFACCKIFKGYVCAVCNAVTDILKAKLIVHADLVVVRFIGKGEGNDACVDKVCAVNTCKGLGDDRLNSEIEGNKSRMLTGRALTVVCTADDDSLACLLTMLGKLLVTLLEAEV